MAANLKELAEDKLPREFRKLIKLRETINQEGDLKKIMRRVEIQEFTSPIVPQH